MGGQISNYVWNKLFQKKVFNKFSFPYGRNHEDIASMHLFLDQAERVVVVDALKYHYRLREGSITKTYSAENLVAYADAYLRQYSFIKNKYAALFTDAQDELLLLPAKGISRLWRWWYGCDRNERKSHAARVKEYCDFTRKRIPFFGFRSWPKLLRVSTIFMYSRSISSFAVMYWLNQVYRKLGSI